MGSSLGKIILHGRYLIVRTALGTAHASCILFFIFTLTNCSGGPQNSRATVEPNSNTTDIEQSESQPPAAVTGSNLLSPTTAAVSYQVSTEGTKRLISASAKYLDGATGKLLEPGGLAQGYSIEWSSFSDSNGNPIATASCNKVNDLRIDCAYSGNATAFKLGFALSDKEGKQSQFGMNKVMPAVSSVTIAAGESLKLDINGSNFTVAPSITVGAQVCSAVNIVSNALMNCTLSSTLTPGEYDVTFTFPDLVMNIAKIFTQSPDRNISLGDYVIFVTRESLVSMALGGFGGSDTYCAALANQGSLSSTLHIAGWHAVLASGASSVRQRMNLALNAKVRLVDGTTVATSAAQFWNDSGATHAAEINIDQDGNHLPAGVDVAIGDTFNNCNDWQNTLAANEFIVGNSASKTMGWWNLGSSKSCSQTAHIYCLGMFGM